MPMNSLSTALRLSASVSRLGLPHNASGDDGAGVTSGHNVIPGQRPERVPNPSNFLLSLAHQTYDQVVQRCRLAAPSGSIQTRCTSFDACSVEAKLALQVAV